MEARETFELEVVSSVDLSEEAHIRPKWEGNRPLLNGRGSRHEGPCDYVCGICHTVLAECFKPHLKSNVVLECPNCGATNRFPDEWSTTM